MIKQTINVEYYWKVIIYYDIDYNLFDYVYSDLKGMNVNENTINRIYKTMYNNYAKGVTISDEEQHKSIVIFNKHKDIYDYINTIVHEAEHVKQAMLRAYDVEDYGEPPAYTIGYLVMKMMKVLDMLV